MMAAGISILLPLEEHAALKGEYLKMAEEKDYTITFPVKDGEIIADKVRRL